MDLFGWFRHEEEITPAEEAAEIEQELLGRMEGLIDEINEIFPLLKQRQPKLNLWIERLERPMRLQLTDWSNAYPEVLFGGR